MELTQEQAQAWIQVSLTFVNKLYGECELPFPESFDPDTEVDRVLEAVYTIMEKANGREVEV